VHGILRLDLLDCIPLKDTSRIAMPQRGQNLRWVGAVALQSSQLGRCEDFSADTDMCKADALAATGQQAAPAPAPDAIR